jgi:ribonuclease III
LKKKEKSKKNHFLLTKRALLSITQKKQKFIPKGRKREFKLIFLQNSKEKLRKKQRAYFKRKIYSLVSIMIHQQIQKEQEIIFSYLKNLWIVTENQQKPENLLIAFVHKSFASDFRENYEHNERLEFLGDWILGAIVNKFLFLDFPELAESQLTLYKIALVREETLAQAAREIKLWEQIYISHGEERMKGREKDSLLSDTFEALIGAIFLSFGLEKTESFIKNFLYEKFLPEISKQSGKSYKTLVQEFIQKEYKIIPEYLETEDEITATGNVTRFKSELFVNGKKLSEWFWPSKKKAQEEAAKNYFEKNNLE